MGKKKGQGKPNNPAISNPVDFEHVVHGVVEGKGVTRAGGETHTDDIGKTVNVSEKHPGLLAGKSAIEAPQDNPMLGAQQGATTEEQQTKIDAAQAARLEAHAKAAKTMQGPETSVFRTPEAARKARARTRLQEAERNVGKMLTVVNAFKAGIPDKAESRAGKSTNDPNAVAEAKTDVNTYLNAISTPSVGSDDEKSNTGTASKK